MFAKNTVFLKGSGISNFVSITSIYVQDERGLGHRYLNVRRNG